VSISTLSAPATRWGAALPGARAPQMTVKLAGLGLGLTHARTQVPASGLTAIAISGIPSTTGAAEAYGVERAAVAGIAGVDQRFQASYGLPTTDNRKQYVHKTRVNADGGGASGPEPEREQALQKAR
jgi:hypothetical protein